MKNTYIAVGIKENGKWYHYVIKVKESDNLLAKLKIQNIEHANVCSTKKRAEELVHLWNECAKLNGCYMFDETFLRKS